MPDSIVEVRIKNNPILHDRQKDVLLQVIKDGQITRSEYIARTGVSASTATRDLSEMVWAGWLERFGPGVYGRGSELMETNDLIGFFHQLPHNPDPDHECGCIPQG